MLGSRHALRLAAAACPPNTPGAPVVLLGDEAPPEWARPGDCLVLLLTTDEFRRNRAYTRAYALVDDSLDMAQVPADAVRLVEGERELPAIAEVFHECTAWAGARTLLADMVVWWDPLLCRRARGAVLRSNSPHYLAGERWGALPFASVDLALVGGKAADHRRCIRRLIDDGVAVQSVTLHTFAGAAPPRPP